MSGICVYLILSKMREEERQWQTGCTPPEPLGGVVAPLVMARLAEVTLPANHTMSGVSGLIWNYTPLPFYISSTSLQSGGQD